MSQNEPGEPGIARQAPTASRAATRALLGVGGLVVVLVAAIGLTVGTGLGEQAAYACYYLDPTCQPSVTVVATETSPGSSGGPGVSVCLRDGTEIPCSTEAGTWYAPFACYIQEVPRDQWPAATDPIYSGTDPANGTLYWCTDDWTGVNRMVFIPGRPPVDPTVLVWQAVASLDLEPVRMGTAPEEGQDRMGLVGLPVWMWVDRPDEHTFGPVTTTAGDGTVSVSLTARVIDVAWDMGDGHTVTCTSAGTPYEDRFGNSQSDTCGYQYTQTSADQPGGQFHVTATSRWEVRWTASTGASGVLRFDRTAATELRVGELQVLNQ